MNNLKQKIASYYKWRKGVLMLMPLELLLIIVAFGLLIIAFYVSLTSTKGKQALLALKNYLNVLEQRFANSSTVDAEAERSNMEKLFNNVKANCHQQVISGDIDLQSKLKRAFEQINTVTLRQTNDTKTAWIKLKALSYDFGTLYFIDFAK